MPRGEEGQRIESWRTQEESILNALRIEQTIKRNRKPMLLQERVLRRTLKCSREASKAEKYQSTGSGAGF